MPLTQSDLLFPSQAHNFSRLLTDLKRSNLSITNRLSSIAADSLFVVSLSAGLALPLVANERCGSWYIPPALKAASAYFKSTDGHFGQWSFSTRRLNLHLLELISEQGGCVVVDSTRRGKGVPDALSKTLPVWCCVMNRVLWPERRERHALWLPGEVVGESERSQIEERLGGFVRDFEALGVDLSAIRGGMDRPLRPVWRGRDDGVELEEDREGGERLGHGEDRFYPVVCCTASRRVRGTELSEAGYIQGAGDDTENWAHGLTANIWWENKEELLAAAEGDLPGLIERLVAEDKEKRDGQSSVRSLPDGIYVTALPVEENSPGTCLVKLVPVVTDKNTWLKSKTEMEVGIGKSKIAGRNLRHTLPTICEFVKGFLLANSGTSAGEETPRVVVACETGKDLAVGVALGLHCWCFDDDGKLRTEGEAMPTFTKTAIRVRLGRIMTAMPDAKPSRTTLQSVNSFLMDWQR